MPDYRDKLVERFWEYKSAHFPDDGSFDRPRAADGRPPVFAKDCALSNVLLTPGISDQQRQEVLLALPRQHWHLWFRSMTSSQALAQSVFGNLTVLGKLRLIADIQDDEGRPVFAGPSGLSERASLEYQVTSLREPRPTSIDVFLAGDYRVAIECKLSETEVGSCSRPTLRPKDSAYASEYCDGRYAPQRGRAEFCSLTARGIAYWRHIPELFNWAAGEQHDPCPLRGTYQLVRNILAACVPESGQLEAGSGHAVLLYDDRNPAFRPGGKGRNAFDAVKRALKQPERLRACTWQTVVDRLAADDDLEHLAAALREKYGL